MGVQGVLNANKLFGNLSDCLHFLVNWFNSIKLFRLNNVKQMLVRVVLFHLCSEVQKGTLKKSTV